MNRTFTCILIFAVLISSAVPATSSVDEDYAGLLNQLDAARTWNTINDLASDEYEGRKAGTQGAELASRYIADNFRSVGLQPAGQSGTYLSEFSMPVWDLIEVPRLAAVGAAGMTGQSFAYRRDFYVQPGSGSGDYSADVVFVGYGITATKLSYDDYSGISVGGKMVLAIIGTPPSDKIREGPYAAWYSKAENAINHGALGLILVDTPANPTPHFIERWSGAWTIYNKLTILRGSIALADTLLKETGTNLSTLQKAIDGSLKPKSLSTGQSLQVSIKTAFKANGKAFNVLGFIPGSDLAASQNVIIVGGHYDHLGKDVDGSIFHGANDNGSGVAVMMEIARVLTSSSKPKWSILFAAWSGEEEGLYGSWAYVEHPYFRLSGTIAYLNLDMVGAGPELSAIISPSHRSLRDVMSQSAAQLHLKLNVWDFSGGSDHVPFEENNVPNLFFIYEPLDEVYHTPSDTAPHISKEKLLETSKLTALITLKLAAATVTSFASASTAIASTEPPQSTTVSTRSETSTQIMSSSSPQIKTTSGTDQQALTGVVTLEIVSMVAIALTIASAFALYLKRRR